MFIWISMKWVKKKIKIFKLRCATLKKLDQWDQIMLEIHRPGCWVTMFVEPYTVCKWEYASNWWKPWRIFSELWQIRDMSDLPRWARKRLGEKRK